MDVRLPDGTIVRNVPEGITQDDLMGRVLEAGGASPASAVPESFGGRVSAGMGQAVYSVARGAGQRLRSALPEKAADYLGLPTQSDIDEARTRDAPLLETGGGKTGAVLGNVAMFAPTSMIPGANTITGAALTGGVMGATQPTSADESWVKNAAIGAGTAGAMQYGTGKLLGALSGAKQSAEREAATAVAQNAGRDAALKAGRNAGYVATPSSVNPSLINETVESLGGKIATAQTASLKNQKVTDTLAREYLGMGRDSILSKGALADARNVAAKPYREIADLSPAAKDALDAWKQANFESKMQWNYFRKSGNPEAYKAAQAAGKAAEDALDAVDAEAMSIAGGQGATRLIGALKDARVRLAKLHTVESALTSGGHVDAKLIAKMGERMPLSDELKIVADFAANFPRAIQTPEKVGGMSHLLRPGIGAGIGTALGGPVGAAVGTGAGVAAPWTVRQMMLSRPGQAAMATPAYGPGAVGAISDLLASPAVRRALPAGGAAAMLNYNAQQ